VVIVADQRGDLAGYVELAGGKFRRTRSTTHVIKGFHGNWLPDTDDEPDKGRDTDDRTVSDLAHEA
jgi:hypothetical protein